MIEFVVATILGIIASILGPVPATVPRTDLGAPSMLARIKVASPVNADTYERERFGVTPTSPSFRWYDADGNGCNSREDVMARDLVNITRPGSCNVVAGSLKSDPYTGRFVRYSERNSGIVQIDHIVSLSQAWRQGASRWTHVQRRAFANDLTNLLAVYGPANASKGDKGPGEWAPLNAAYRCTYARQYVATVYRYRNYPLTIDPATHDALALTLTRCNERITP